MFSIAFAASALDDIRWFRKYDQGIIFDGIEELLTFQPDVETRNHKKLRSSLVSEWEVRLNQYRVFYAEAGTPREPRPEDRGWPRVSVG